MRIRIAVPDAHVEPDVVDAALEAVTRLDEHMIRAGEIPSSDQLISQGAKWRPENMGDEHFDHGGTIASRGWGDCDDWAPLHAASLRTSGEDPGATARVVRSGPGTYHAIVQRTDGSIDDPSIAAGMKAKRVGGIDDESIHVLACDPHDGRVYEGSLFPAVGPLSLNCGPSFAVRPSVVGGYEGRCDMPFVGSRLVRVRSYKRHAAPHRRRHVHGEVPFALSCTTQDRDAVQALNDAIVGAVLTGDAAEVALPLDRLKLMSVQALLTGMHPADVVQAIAQHVGPELGDPYQVANAIVQVAVPTTTRVLGALCRRP